MENQNEIERKDTVRIPRSVLFVIADVLTVLFSYFFALLLRFDFRFSLIPEEYMDGFLKSILLWAAVTVVVLYFCHLYHSIWSHVSTTEFFFIVKAYVILVPVYFVCYLVCHLLFGFHMPRSYYVMGILISFCLTVATRFAYRFLRIFVNRSRAAGAGPRENIMVIGAGAAGETLIREIDGSDKLNAKVCCAIDDNPAKKGRRIAGVPIVGGREAILQAAEKYDIDKIIYAIPSGSGELRRRILDICKETGCRLQILPGIYQIVDEEVSVSRLRNVELSDLLGREQIQVNSDEILSVITGKTILVTGGGGSIGSELCRQIAKSSPKGLIIFDIYENNAYDIQMELRRTHPELNLTVLIGSVRNTARINAVMEQYRPDIVFHAAAHKHVPLMEDSPNEAIKNNTIGTWKTAEAAARWGVKKFVLISTDKAVNPTSIMGASKRMCEMIVQLMDRRTEGTDFVAVRFGNVLGSNGSVVPLFQKQIAEGGPVTVTDPNVIRYFMTIPEAVSLVLQATHYARGGEIFVLDMGEPVRIDDMARNLIRLSGYVPDVDIKIVYTGLRPGEKLYEELLMDEEGLTETENHLIYIGHPIQMNDERFEQKLIELDRAAEEESGRVRELVAEIVPTYQYQKPEPQAAGSE